jgi:hypothetical protein
VDVARAWMTVFLAVIGLLGKEAELRSDSASWTLDRQRIVGITVGSK